MLTAKVEEEDLVRGLNLGADDYLTKPFSPRELIARIRAVLRRTAGGKKVQVDLLSTEDGFLQIDGVRRRVEAGGESIDLTATEFDLLYNLMKTPERVFTREQLVDLLWGYYSDREPRTIDVHIKNLRKKLKDAGNMVRTVYGVGYKFSEERSESE